MVGYNAFTLMCLKHRNATVLFEKLKTQDDLGFMTNYLGAAKKKKKSWGFEEFSSSGDH